MNKKAMFLALTSAAILPGCASIVSQSSWPVAIQIGRKPGHV